MNIQHPLDDFSLLIVIVCIIIIPITLMPLHSYLKNNIQKRSAHVTDNESKITEIAKLLHRGIAWNLECFQYDKPLINVLRDECRRLLQAVTSEHVDTNKVTNIYPFVTEVLFPYIVSRYKLETLGIHTETDSLATLIDQTKVICDDLEIEIHLVKQNEIKKETDTYNQIRQQIQSD